MDGRKRLHKITLERILVHLLRDLEDILDQYIPSGGVWKLEIERLADGSARLTFLPRETLLKLNQNTLTTIRLSYGSTRCYPATDMARRATSSASKARGFASSAPSHGGPGAKDAREVDLPR